MTDFSLIRGADVKLTHVVNDKKQNVAEIIVDGKFSHRFSPKSRVSKHLDVMAPADLEARLNGGTFFFVDDEMVDFRDASYNGFIQSEATIEKFMDLLGYQHKSDLPRHRGRIRTDDEGSNIVLRKVWDKSEIQVPGYAMGGEFTSELSFVWNPFVKTINSAFDLVRLVCTNGMIGLTSFLNTKIPLENRWEEHLDIATRQIQNKVNNIVIERMKSMATERASVADCLLLEQHAFERLISGHGKSPEERERLKAIVSAVAPKFHLHNTYRDGVFADKALAAQLPGHLTNIDVFNIATELRSHTQESSKSSDNALDRMSNSILFDRNENSVAAGSRYTVKPTSSFADPSRAFYGIVN